MVDSLLVPFLFFNILHFQEITVIDSALMPILDSINVVSIQENYEYGGTVYYCDGKIVIPNPSTDSSKHGVTIYSNDSLRNEGCFKIALYHTHADCSHKEYEDENFSDIDTSKATILNYLATPFGRILKYVPWEGKTYEFNRVFKIWSEYNGIFDNSQISTPHPFLKNVSPEIIKLIEGNYGPALRKGN